jgi:CRP-like cAMP-binding protein
VTTHGPLFEGATEQEAARLLERARRRSFDAGEVVFHAGDPADTLHLIQRGRFAVRVTTEFGDVATLNVMGPGDFFGELALLNPRTPRSATVIALEKAETLSVHELDFGRLRTERPQTADVLIAILAAQVRRLSTHLAEALYGRTRACAAGCSTWQRSTARASRPPCRSRRRSWPRWREPRAPRSTACCARRRSTAR